MRDAQVPNQLYNLCLRLTQIHHRLSNLPLSRIPGSLFATCPNPFGSLETGGLSYRQITCHGWLLPDLGTTDEGAPHS